MLKISQSIIDQINDATTGDDLHNFLQAALELEHSTIPPYLTALYSIQSDPDGIVTDILRSTVVEEMLHFAIVGNLMVALNGKPVIKNKDFVPKYPGPLPMIEDSVIVGLKKFSPDLVENVFMEIEKPEHPLEIPMALDFALKMPQYATIGDFYRAIQDKVKDLPNSSFTNADLQVTSPDFYSPKLLFKITNGQEAAAAIENIIEQGEGTDKSPQAPIVDDTDEPAHYYRFQQIIKGRLIKKDPEKGYIFGGDKIDLGSLVVYPLWDNTKIKDLEGHPAELEALNNFNISYTQLLAGLDDTFNGNPAKLGDTIRIAMHKLRNLANNLVKIPIPGRPGFNIGPSFEYTE